MPILQNEICMEAVQKWSAKCWSAAVPRSCFHCLGPRIAVKSFPISPKRRGSWGQKALEYVQEESGRQCWLRTASLVPRWAIQVQNLNFRGLPTNDEMSTLCLTSGSVTAEINAVARAVTA